MQAQARTLLRKIIPANLHLAAQLQRKILREAAGRVIGGPFKGMRYTELSYGGVNFPKILGIYEKELHGTLERLLQLKFDLVVVVGAAEGFYPVGFALRTNSEIQIVTFDAAPPTWKLLEELAESNGVNGRIRRNGLCDIGSLRACLAESSCPFLFMDIEGGEAILLDPEFLPELRRAHILVEVHEGSIPGTGGILRKRFAPTHRITEIVSQERIIDDFPIAIPGLFKGAAVQLISEKRGGSQSWLVIEPLTWPATPGVAPHTPGRIRANPAAKATAAQRLS
jgi:hypothetical protein